MSSLPFFALLLALNARAQNVPGFAPESVSNICLGCICEAASGCNTTVGCTGEVCGPFRITWAYWADSGKPTQQNEPETSNTAYSNCVNEPSCAAKAVTAYMQKYGKDCNRDGKINCDDYVRIHRFGSYSCDNPLDPKYDSVYTQCIKTFG